MGDGKEIAEAREIRLAVPESYRQFFPPQHIGRLMSMMGIPHRKRWPKEGGMQRLYLLKESKPRGPV